MGVEPGNKVVKRSLHPNPAPGSPTSIAWMVTEKGMHERAQHWGRKPMFYSMQGETIMNEWTYYLTQFTRTPNKSLSDFWTLWQCAVRAPPLESDCSGAASRPCPSNCPSLAQQWEEWVNQWVLLLLQASSAFLFQREILQVNIFMLLYRLCLYTFNFDPNSPAKNHPIVGCLEMPQPSYHYKDSDQNSEHSTAERWKKLNKQLTESPKLFKSCCCIHHFWTRLIWQLLCVWNKKCPCYIGGNVLPQQRPHFLRMKCFLFILGLTYIETLKCIAVI